MSEPAAQTPPNGDRPVGHFVPEDVFPSDFTRIPRARLDAIAQVSGLTATVSDVLEKQGFALAVPADILTPRQHVPTTVVGHALTLRYLPERRPSVQAPSRYAHATLASMAHPGDILVIDGMGNERLSCFGGMAAHVAATAGVGAVVVHGGIRDLDEISAAQLLIWSSSVTPISGNRRLEAVALNRPISCGGVQVCVGDVVVADASGVCFIPLEVADQVIDGVLEVAREEAQLRGEPR